MIDSGPSSSQLKAGTSLAGDALPGHAASVVLVVVLCRTCLSVHFILQASLALLPVCSQALLHGFEGSLPLLLCSHDMVSNTFEVLLDEAENAISCLD